MGGRQERATWLKLITTMGLALLVWSTAIAVGGGAQRWEIRVCADPNSLPFSHEDESGFENVIAEIIAADLGATLTYDWWPQTEAMISDRLREGECDLIMGVPDGHSTLLTTIAYYRSPYVFVYRKDSGLRLESINDPLLHELSIGVQRTSMPPHEALLRAGLSGNVEIQYGAAPYLRFEEGKYVDDPTRLAPLIEDVVSERVDVGVAWGPTGGYYAARAGTELEVVPILPEVLPSGLQMVISMTIGVRAGDEALRDRLNVVIAERWEEIQEVLRQYSVPLSPLPQPITTGRER